MVPTDGLYLITIETVVPTDWLYLITIETAVPRDGLYLKMICVLLVILMDVFMKQRQRIPDEQVGVMTGQLFIDAWHYKT